MAVNLDNLVSDYADDLATRTRQRKPVIDPNSNTLGDVIELFPTSVTVMDPRNMVVQDSKGMIDTRNNPQALRELGQAIGSSVEVEGSETTDMISKEIQNNSEVNESVVKLARLIDTRLDDLTQTVSLESAQQLEELRAHTTALTLLKDTQVQDGELRKRLQDENIEFQKERDFDNNRPIATEDSPLPVVPQEPKTDKPTPGRGGPSLFDALFGAGVAGGAGKGRIFRIIGLLGRSLLGLAGGILIADQIVKKFFGKDLVTFVKDGFKYILDNWDQLLVQGFSAIGSMIAELPSMIGNAVKSIGIVIKSVLLSIFEKIPFLKDMLDIEDTYDQIQDRVTSDYEKSSGNFGTNALGVAGGAALGYGALKYGTNKLKDGVARFRSSPETMAEQAGRQGTPDSNRQGATTKKGFFRRKGKLGLILTAASVLGMSMGSDDVAAMEEEYEPQRPPSPDINENSQQVERQSFDATAAAATLALTAGSAYAIRSRAPETSAQVNNVPVGKEKVMPKPVSGRQAVDLVDDVAKAGKAGIGRQALRTLGRIPGLSIALAGMDAYNISQDTEMTDREKTVEYAGVGGALAGAGAGAAGGAALGTMLFPGVGTAVGGFLGGILGAYLGEEGVEKVADWITGPEPTEAQELTGTVSSDSIPTGNKSVRSLRRRNRPKPETDADQADQADVSKSTAPRMRRRRGSQGSQPSTIVEQDNVETSVPAAEPEPAKTSRNRRRRGRYASPDRQAIAVEQTAVDIVAQSSGTISRSKAIQLAEAELGLEESPVNDSLAKMDLDSVAEAAEVQSELPEVVTGLQTGETIREQTPVQPEVVVNMMPTPEKQQKDKPVAKTVRPNTGRTNKGAGFSQSPTLANVPVVIEDGTFALIQLGYI